MSIPAGNFFLFKDDELFIGPNDSIEELEAHIVESGVIGKRYDIYKLVREELFVVEKVSRRLGRASEKEE